MQKDNFVYFCVFLWFFMCYLIVKFKSGIFYLKAF